MFSLCLCRTSEHPDRTIPLGLSGFHRSTRHWTFHPWQSDKGDINETSVECFQDRIRSTPDCRKHRLRSGLSCLRRQLGHGDSLRPEHRRSLCPDRRRHPSGLWMDFRRQDSQLLMPDSNVGLPRQTATVAVYPVPMCKHLVRGTSKRFSSI